MIKSSVMYGLAVITGVIGFILAVVSSGILAQTDGNSQAINWLASFYVIIGTALTCVLWVFCGTVLSHLEYLRMEHSKNDASQGDINIEEMTSHNMPTTFGRR